MMLFLAIVVTACLALLVSAYWKGPFSGAGAADSPEFGRWLALGLIGPGFAWVFLNCGLFLALPPILPDIALAKSRGQTWIPLIFRNTAPGILTIGSYWAAVSFGQLAISIGLAADSRKEFAVLTTVLGIVASPFVYLAAKSGGLPWAGFAVLLWLVPVVHCTADLAWRPNLVPSYAGAIARVKLGKYREAESEVIHQLEQREDDFDGWIMLAELYASQFGDLPEADRTVRFACDQPNATALQTSMAFHRLADWHLKFGDDPVSARLALTELCRRMPNSHFARMAHLRLDTLPTSRQEWLESKKPKSIRLPALTGELDATSPPRAPRLTRTDAATLANQCSERLRRNPNETAPREQLAALLVEELGKIDPGIEQIELLIEMAGQPENKRAEWLSRLASWQLRYRHDRVAAKKTLGRLVREFPQSTQAFAGQRWLNLLEMEERSRLNAKAPLASAPAVESPKIRVEM